VSAAAPAREPDVFQAVADLYDAAEHLAIVINWAPDADAARRRLRAAHLSLMRAQIDALIEIAGRP
jgi:hypothetical protein